MLAVFVLSLLSLASSDCACLCIDGAARTVCRNLAEAQANPNLCLAAGIRDSCPLPAGEFTPERFTSPSPGAEDCREARVWDPKTGDYNHVARVCDAVVPDGPDT